MNNVLPSANFCVCMLIIAEIRCFLTDTHQQCEAAHRAPMLWHVRALATATAAHPIAHNSELMSAWVCEQYKAPLIRRRVRIPEITAGNQLLIKVHASSVNPIDSRMCEVWRLFSVFIQFALRSLQGYGHEMMSAIQKIERRCPSGLLPNFSKARRAVNAAAHNAQRAVNSAARSANEATRRVATAAEGRDSRRREGRSTQAASSAAARSAKTGLYPLCSILSS